MVSRIWEMPRRLKISGAAEAPAHGESVLSYAPRSNPSQDFQALLDELMSI